MKSTGIVRKIDNLGRLVLPVELRRGLGLDEDPTVEIFVEEDTIVLKKYQPACLFCGEAKNVTPYMGRNICANCRAAIAKQLKHPDPAKNRPGRGSAKAERARPVWPFDWFD